MKHLSLLIIALLCSISAIAQPWIEPTPGSIYYQGNVGIGTTNPVVKLDVLGRGVFGTGTMSRTGYGSTLSLVNNSGSSTSLFIWQEGIGSGHFGFRANDYNLYIVNSYTDGAVTNPAAIALSPTGNVGIGTTEPDKKLHVAGDIHVGGVGNGIFFDTSGSTAGASIKMTDYAMTLENNRGNAARLSLTNNNISLSDCSGSRLFINTSSGNVGIGTTTPEAKLTVKGKIVASEVQVKDINSIADYVFKPDYQLMSLNRVEDFVKQNQHLPEVPSEKEFKKDGMNVAEMNALLLKKVEELTLYLIDQNKQINQLKEENKIIRKMIAN